MPPGLVTVSRMPKTAPKTKVSPPAIRNICAVARQLSANLSVYAITFGMILASHSATRDHLHSHIMGPQILDHGPAFFLFPVDQDHQASQGVAPQELDVAEDNVHIHAEAA